jgi:hypothetical protein
VSACSCVTTRFEPEPCEAPLCIGHAPPSAQQAIRASGVGAHPAHTAAFPPRRPRDSRTAVKRWRISTNLSADFHKYGGIRPAMHPASRRCSSVTYSRYSPSSRLARRAPRRPWCVAVFMRRTTYDARPDAECQTSAGTYNRRVRRVAAVIVMVLFASLNAIDGICCPDGCTHEQESSGATSPSPNDGACFLCLGSVERWAPQDVSPGIALATQIIRTPIDSPDAVPSDPPDHPPRV